MFYYDRYKNGFKYRKLDFTDCFEVWSYEYVKKEAESYDINVKLEDFDLSEDEIEEYIRNCHHCKEPFHEIFKEDAWNCYVIFFLLYNFYSDGLYNY